MLTIQKSRQLVEYVKGISAFRVPSEYCVSYQHMGAVLTDSVLQAGMSYEAVVRPRVASILKRFPAAATSSLFLRAIQEHGAEDVLRWRAGEKPRRLVELACFLVEKRLETCGDLGTFLRDEGNASQLRTVRGVGPKTVDYMRRLVGLDSVAVDRHIRRALMMAGVGAKDYEECRVVVSFAADLLRVPRASFDAALWKVVASGELGRKPARQNRRHPGMSVVDSVAMSD